LRTITARPRSVSSCPSWGGRFWTGHCLQNRSGADCSFVAISAGDAAGDSGDYPDIDMQFGSAGFTRKDGTPY
jgi:uncharacterized cupin superfamily protein